MTEALGSASAPATNAMTTLPRSIPQYIVSKAMRNAGQRGEGYRGARKVSAGAGASRQFLLKFKNRT